MAQSNNSTAIPFVFTLGKGILFDTLNPNGADPLFAGVLEQQPDETLPYGTSRQRFNLIADKTFNVSGLPPKAIYSCVERIEIALQRHLQSERKPQITLV
jgi:hypothetical protein